MKEKMIALQEAVAAVNRAIDAIENFAEEQKIDQLPEPGATMTIEDFSYMVARLIGKDPECVDHILHTAFYLMKDLNLTITDDDDDDEYEEDEDDE